jgi:hypothetical protein
VELRQVLDEAIVRSVGTSEIYHGRWWEEGYNVMIRLERDRVRTTLRRERKKRVKGLFLELRLVIYRVDLSHTEPLVIPNP